jgi:NAD(P)-dependent dehydrogenase (short-subunit alcohol dehydrogenase family)
VYLTSKVAVRSFTANVAIEEREFGICIVSMGPGGALAPGLRGIWTEDVDEKYRAGMAPLESIGNRYVLAAEAPMELSGHQITVSDGALVVADE